jgi:hypothetical protein
MPYQRMRRRITTGRHNNNSNSKQSQDTTDQSTNTTAQSSSSIEHTVSAKALEHHQTYTEEVTQVERELSGFSLSGAAIQTLTFIQAHGDISKFIVLLIDQMLRDVDLNDRRM